MENKLLEDLNHLTNEAVTGRVIENKLKIFRPSDGAHRAICPEIFDERKLNNFSTTESFSTTHPVCVKCAAPHKAKDCPKPNEAPPCCTLCKGNHTTNFSECLCNPANFVPAPPPKTNYWEERMKIMKTNKLPLTAPTSLQKNYFYKPSKSTPNQVQSQLLGPSTSFSIPQENLTAQLLQSLVKEVHVFTSNIASLLAVLQSQSPLYHNIQ
ncbi:hypothetical protein CDAR_111741 [Caerostris darwini]|uniref:Uncharacterized protein n=1 Tax=Caerostris darwini TaxID=1538125 RepID=A0AAV4TXA4_9ARAC|nr:hypothetical protein CDAR_111741 [Caerostris darwini]